MLLSNEDCDIDYILMEMRKVSASVGMSFVEIIALTEFLSTRTAQIVLISYIILRKMRTKAKTSSTVVAVSVTIAAAASGATETTLVEQHVQTADTPSKFQEKVMHAFIIII